MTATTKTTFKSFIRKNADKLWINVRSRFDGQTDGIEQRAGGFVPAQTAGEFFEHTYGIQGAWLVGHGGDRFQPYAENGFTGIRVNNCCGSFIVATRD